MAGTAARHLGKLVLEEEDDRHYDDWQEEESNYSSCDHYPLTPAERLSSVSSFQSSYSMRGLHITPRA